MATYVNDLRLKEIGTGESSGTWGTETNVNLELIGEALSFGTEAITTNADTHTSTVADGSTDPARSMYIKYTGTLDSACTITIAPNTLSRLHFIENGTSGSQNIIISQGSGANVTIPPGDVKVVYLDGAGSGAAVVDAFASLNVVDLKVEDDLTVTDDMTVGGTLGVTGNITGTLATAAQTNITSLGTLTSLTVGGSQTDFSPSVTVNNTSSSNGSTGAIRFVTESESTGLIIGKHSSGHGTADLAFINQELNADLAISTNNTERMRISSSGAFSVTGATTFGIGVDIDGSDDLRLRFLNGSTFKGGIQVPTSTGDMISGAAVDDLAIRSQGDIRFATGGNTERMNILDTGINVTGSISSTNDITITSAGPAISLVDSDNNPDYQIKNGNGSLRFIDTTNTVDLATFTAGEVAINEGSADVDFRVESNGKTHMLFVDGGEDLVLIGTGTKSVVSGGDPGLQVSGNGFDSIVGITRHDTNAFGAQIMLAKSRNATVGSNTILQDNDGVGAIGFFADDGTNLDSQVAYVSAEIDGTPGENDTPGALTFSTTADGSAAVTERMRIDDQGLVGINWGASSARLGIIQSGSSTPGMNITDGSTSDFRVFAGHSTGVTRIGTSAGHLALDTTNTERARLTTGGVLLVNSTGAIGPGMICARSDASSTGAFGAFNSHSGGSLMRFANAANNAVIGTITNNGNTAVAYNTTSDYRLKENINYTWEATNRLKQLKPAQFNFISDESNTTIDGFIAHEVSSVVPAAVTGEKDEVNEQGDPEYQGIDHSKLVPLLVKTIQELEARITALES